MLFQWATTWNMSFNLNRCEYMKITLKHNPLSFNYTMNGIRIKEVSTTKYLDITINNHLIWSNHIDDFSNKALSIISNCFVTRLVERFNRTLKTMLSKLVENKGCNWDRLLAPVLFVYRTTPHSSTEETPFFLLYGKDAKLPLALDFYSPELLLFVQNMGKHFFESLKRSVT